MSETAWFAKGIEGRHVLIGFIAFFGVIFLANGIFLYYALATFGGGDTSDPYRKGLHYNDTLAQAARQAERGWKEALIYGAETGRLVLSLADKEGLPISGLHLSANVGRAATDREDASVKLREAQAGTYAAELRLAPGQWVVQLQSEELSRAGDPAYRLKQRILIPESP
jgi:nitrogen fixation protein FixH